VVPGTMTPSEMISAMQAGAAAVKLFPAGRLGTGYVKDVRAALDDVPIVAVGGVSVENAAGWIQAGCIGVGIGGSLLDAGMIAAHDMAGLEERARTLLRSFT
jgi:2-dehydro-3-deoxyphosphogluconate aldolase / (4S)-4-hydroxy-2-oxoglutarate aldolase